jgi:hypothetical protein
VTGDPNLNAVDVNLYLRMSDLRLDVTDDQKMDVNLYLRMSVLHLDAKNRDVMTDVSRDRRRNDLLDDLNLVVKTDVSRDLRRNDLHLDVTDDRNLNAVDVSRDLRMSDLHLDVKILDVKMNCHRVNRKCALHVKNYQCHRVDLSIDPECYDLNMNCDQLSRDHLLCDHRKLRHLGTSLNLGAKMMNHVMCYQSHRVDLSIDPEYYDLTHLNHVKMSYRGNPMMVDQRMDAKDASWMTNYGHLDDPVNGTMIYLQAWLLLFLKLGESDRY